jgi:hypothetical protein
VARIVGLLRGRLSMWLSLSICWCVTIAFDQLLVGQSVRRWDVKSFGQSVGWCLAGWLIGGLGGSSFRRVSWAVGGLVFWRIGLLVDGWIRWLIGWSMGRLGFGSVTWNGGPV